MEASSPKKESGMFSFMGNSENNAEKKSNSIFDGITLTWKAKYNCL